MRFPKLRKAMVFFACLVVALAFGAANLSAQDTTKVSGKMTATYTQLDSIVVGDVAGHVISLSASQGKNASTGKKAFMDGAKIVNMSYSDVTMGNGSHQGYVKFTKDDDAVYAKWMGRIATTKTPEGAPVVTFEGSFMYIKGTGKLDGITGKGSYKGAFTSKTEYSVEWQGHYILKK